jgi:RNA polymerase sigma-70 factor (ECF subfamily)
MRSPGDERKAGKRLGELYAEHAAAVYAYAFHLLGTREEAEDVVQIAFLHAHRSLVRGEELVHPRAWLSTVVKRQAFNRWRDRRELPVADPAVDRQPAEPGEAAEKLSQVRAVLFSLPEAQHQAFVLRHWSGLSTREIGQVLGTTESAAESLLVRARASIIAAGHVAADCITIREKLVGGAELSSPQVRHVATCSGCSRAQQRLTRIAAAAVVLGLVPHAHVAQALAASVPGFTVAGASAGAGAAGAGLAAKGAVAKVAASLVISAVAVTAVAPLALHAAHRLHDGPVAGPVRARSVVHAAAVAQVTPGARPRGFAVTGDVTGDGTPGETTGASTKDGRSGGASSDGSSSQSSGSSDGSGGSAGSSQTSSGDGTSQSGSDGSGDGGSGNVTSGDGSTSTDGGSTSGDSQGSSTDGSGGQ